MNRKQYIASLRRSLRGINRNSREEIVREIESHIREMPEESSLVDRFGTPDELAKRYLEGVHVAPSAGKRAIGIGKTLLAVIGSIVLAVMIAVIVFFNYWNRDSFDYSNESAAELGDSTWGWHQVDRRSSLTVNVEQAKSVFYWHARDTLTWHCEGNDGEDRYQGEKLDIRQDECVIYLPRYLTSLNVKQGDVVLVRPQADIRVDITQGKLRIAENDTAYRYQINSNRSDIGDFRSDESAPVLIDIEAMESRAEYYSY